jgi:hypothetical protein
LCATAKEAEQESPSGGRQQERTITTKRIRRTIMLQRIVRIPAALFLVCFVIVSAADAQDGPRYSHTGSVLVSDIRVIDGLGNEPSEHRDIVIIDGKIGAIGPTGTLDVPSDALTIAGQGLTAMPGLIDMHIHLQGSWAHGNLEGKQYAIRYDDEAIQQRLNGYLPWCTTRDFGPQLSSTR